MPDAGERSYAYTKACGIIGKSFVGKRISALSGLRSLNEFDRVVFPGLRRELPGRELLIDIEGRIVRRAVKHILSVVNSYARPPELLVRQIRLYEYGDLKTCLHYFAGGKKGLPPLCDIGRFRTVNFAAFPDLEEMLEGTEFAWILEKGLKAPGQGNFDIAELETFLDRQYYLGVTKSLRRLSGDDRAFAERILAEEISLRNCVWALRLRCYYKKTAEETAKYLMDIRMRSAGGGEISLAAEALESLSMGLDTRSAWQGWRWEKFLGREKPGEIWMADPRYFQNAASEYIYGLAMHCFHRMPLAVSTVFCYIKLKQFEEDLLTSIAEGLGLGMTGGEVFDLLEFAP
jgi:hypothetical protein